MRTRYSLLELLTAVTVAGVLAALAVGVVVQRVGQATLYSTAADIAGKLNSCRRLAADTGHICLVAFPLVDKHIDGGQYDWDEFTAVADYFVSYGMYAPPHAPESMPGSMMRMAIGYNAFSSMSNGLRCWDFLPRDSSARTCAVGDNGSYNEVMGSLDFQPHADGTQTGTVSIIGFGGAANTSVLQDDLVSAPSYTAYAHSGIGFQSDGRLANPNQDLDCNGELHIWVANWKAWQTSGTKEFIEIAVNRTGHISWRDGEQATVDPFDASSLDHVEDNGCAVP